MRAFLILCLLVSSVGCVAIKQKGPYRLGVLRLDPELDRIKPLAEADFASWAQSSNILVGSVGSEWVVAQSLQNSKILWWLKAETPLAAPVTIVGNWVLLGFRDGTVYKVELETGKKIWELTLDSFVSRKFNLAGNILLAQTAGQQLYGIDFDSGSTVWIYDAGFPDGLNLQGAAPPVSDNNVVVIGIASGELHAVDLKSGKLSWKHEPSFNEGRFHDVMGEIALFDSRLIFSRYDGMVSLLDVSGKGQNVLWELETSNVTAASFRAGRYYVGTLDGDVFAIDIKTGKKIWTASTGEAITAIIPGETTLFTSGGNGRINSINSLTGEIHWNDSIGAEIVRDPFIYQDGVYFTTGFRNIYGYKIN